MHSSQVVLAGTASQAGVKLFDVIATVAVFVAALLVIFAVVGKVTGRLERPLAIVVLVFPAVLLSLAGLVGPAIKTILTSFTNEQAAGQKLRIVDGKLVQYHPRYVGLKNYTYAFTDSYTLHTLLRTLLWIVIAPLASVIVGLVLALLLDRMKHTAIPRTLIFLPTAVSFVGASLIFALVYNSPVFNSRGKPGSQTGLLSEVVIKLGWHNPPNWLLDTSINSYLLMVILVWVQVGFAMVVLGAALKAIPEEILEAARIDGANGFTLFRTVQIPMIRNTVVVVATTIVIASLKLFDIIATLTGGNYNTDVLANQVYTQLFVTNQTGRGSALAVILFISVIPLVAYNIVQLRRGRATR